MFAAAMRLLSQRRPRHARDIAGAVLETVLYPVVRYRRRQIWSACLTDPRQPSQWRGGETIVFIGPGNFDSEVTAALAAFAGNDEGALAGVRRGDCLCVVADASGYLGCTFAFFTANTPETRRQSKILGAAPDTPIAGLSFTIPRARGRAIYRRALNDLFIHLRARGCQECVCEIHPDNGASQSASRAAGMTLRRESTDWIVLRRLVIQRVCPVNGHRFWRLFLV